MSDAWTRYYVFGRSVFSRDPRGRVATKDVYSTGLLCGLRLARKVE